MKKVCLGLLLLAASGAFAEELKIKFAVLSGLELKPIPLRKVQLKSDGKVKHEGTTSVTGEIVFTVAPGKYVVSLAEPLVLGDASLTWNKELLVETGRNLDITITDEDALKSAISNSKRKSAESELFNESKSAVVQVIGDGGTGSGFLVDASGLILTNQHVSNQSMSISVCLSTGQRFRARILAEDKESDVAVLQIPVELAKSMTVLKLAMPPRDSPLAVEGEKVIAIGSPLHQSGIMTLGIVSKVLSDAIISDVNLNHGNSGGPVLNMDGEVIGIGTFLDSLTNGPGISGIVAITKASGVLDKARALLSSSPDIAVEKLPDFPEKQIDPSMLASAAKGIDDKLIRIKAPRSFDTYIDTPLWAESRNTRLEREFDKAAARRGDKNRKSSIEPVRYWEKYVGNRSQAVVTISVRPAPLETSASKTGGFLGAVLGVRTKATMEFRHDFYEMKLYRDGTLIQPVREFRMPREAWFDSEEVRIKDSAYQGVYFYAINDFRSGRVFEIETRTDKDPNKWERFKLAEKELKRILKSFEGY